MDVDHEQEGVDQLMPDDELVDELFEAVKASDVPAVVSWLKEFERRGRLSSINDVDGITGISPFVAAAAKEASPVSFLLVRLLAAKGAALPSATSPSRWLEMVQPWAIELIEGEKQAHEAAEVEQLFKMRDSEAAAWCKARFGPEITPAPLVRDVEPLHIGFDRLRVASPAFVGPFTRSTSAISRPIELVLPPRSVRFSPVVEHQTVKSEEEQDQVFEEQPPSLGFIDLTLSRTPSPLLQIKEEDENVIDLTELGDDGDVKQETVRFNASAVRAHLRIANLPSSCTDSELRDVFSALPGFVDASIEKTRKGEVFGFVSLSSFAAAQHAFAVMHERYLRSEHALDPSLEPLQLRVYSADGQALDPDVGPIEVVKQPYHLPAAQLRRRLYLGALRTDITGEEILNLVHTVAGVPVEVRVLKVARDESHAFAILQFPDSVTATHAQTTLHGTPFDGHLVNLHPVNELRHNWTKFSLQIHGVPPSWTYRVVSDALVTTICRFAGLVARPKPPRYDELKVKVEFWYASEAVWAARELDGKLVEGHAIRAVLDNPQLQKKALGNAHETTTSGGSTTGHGDGASQRGDLVLSTIHSRSPSARSTAPSSPAATTTHRSREGSRDVEMRDVDVDVDVAVAPPVVVKPLGALSSSTSGAVTARSGSRGARDGVWRGARKMHGVV